MGEIPTADWSRIDEEARRFEQDWKAGRRPRIEDALDRREGPRLAPLLKELLRVERELRRKAGKSATPRGVLPPIPGPCRGHRLGLSPAISRLLRASPDRVVGTGPRRRRGAARCGRAPRLRGHPLARQRHGPRRAGALGLEAVLLGRVLEAVTGKSPVTIVVAEVVQPQRIRGVTPAGETSGRPDGLFHLAAPAPEVGQFFRKHELDGRPVSPPAKPADGARLGRRGTALGPIRRRGEWLFVVLPKLPGGAPPELAAELGAHLDRAVDSLPTSPASTVQRQAPSRKKGGAR